MALIVSNLTKRYDQIVIDQFSYRFDRGRLYVIKGVSGCGKTTLLNILGGLDSAYEGEVSYEGNTNRDGLIAAVGYIFQQSLLISDQTVKNNLLLINNDSVKIEAVMERLGISHLYDKFPAELSGGERQRVAVARALITGVKVLLADEPTASLDETNSIEIALMLSELRAEGCTVIVATHEHYFDEFADEIISLDYGNIDYVDIRTPRKQETSAEHNVFTSASFAGKRGKKSRKNRKGEKMALMKMIFARGRRQWRLSSFIPTIILTLLILLISTITNGVDKILLGYLEHYYPANLVKINEERLVKVEQKLGDRLTAYYPYAAEENGVLALYYAKKEDSVLAGEGMLKYGYFPETENEIIVSYEFAEQKVGSINSVEDIIGQTYVFGGREFTITGCLHSFDEDIDVGLFFSAEGLFDSDMLYFRNRGSMIFMDYDVIKGMGGLAYNEYGSITVSCNNWMHDPEVADIFHDMYSEGFSLNEIEKTIKNTSQNVDAFMLILYFVLIVCFLIACIFIRSKVDIELFYRSREIGFLRIFKMKKRKLKQMILWEYLVRLGISLIVPLCIYAVIVTAASFYLHTLIVFDVVHISVAFGSLLLLYIHALCGTIKKYLKRDVVELIRA